MVEIRGQRLHVALTGSEGPSVICCHSTGLSGSQFKRLARCLAPRRCLRPDWLGYGGSDRPGPQGKDWRVDQELIAHLVERAEEPVDLVGHSYGGFVALKIALAMPHKVRRVVVHEPVLWGCLISAGPADQVATFRKIVRAFEGLPRGGEVWMRDFIHFWNGPGSWEALAPHRADAWRIDGQHVATEVHRLLDDTTPHSEWAQLSIPVLVTVGESTNPLEHRVCEILADAVHTVRLAVVPGGHMAPLTHGRHWLDAVVPFVGDEA